MLTFCMLAAIPPVDCPPAAIPIPLSPFPPASSTLLGSFFKSSRDGCPLFSFSYEFPILQPLCFDIHASDGGVYPPPKKKWPPVLHTIRHCALHSIKEEEPAEKDERDGGSGSEKEEAGSVAAAGDGPAETVNDAGHGIEAVEPAPAVGDERGRVGDGRGEHPELDEEGDNVADVAIERVERGKPEADAESGEKRESEKRGEPERGERGANTVGESENGEDYEADGEIHEAGKRGGNGKNQAREIHFGDEALVFDDDVGGHLEGVGEVGPGNESGEIKNGIGEAVGGQLG